MTTPKRDRNRNYQPFEDLLLCRAYVRVYQDPTKGKDQTAADFWTKVTEVFNKMLEDYEVELGECIVSRDNFEKNKTRFTKQIMPAVSKFNGYFTHEKRNAKSGVDDPNSILESAKQRFKENQNGKEFAFEACYDVLKQMPKFSSGAGNSEDGGAFTNVWSKAERPEGTKAAKRRAVEQISKKKRSKLMENLVRSNERMVLVMNNKVKQDRLFQMMSFYEKIGNEAKVAEYLQKLEQCEMPAEEKPAEDIAVSTQNSELSSL
ncbi:MAG: hypothetical protein SGBAC_006442 [Bacillariaceae sp.]